MLPKDAAKTTITVYNFLSPYGALHRTVIRNCVWMQGNRADRRKQGTGSPDDVVIQIPYRHQYFSVQNGQEYFGDGWTVRVGPTELETSYILKGECPFLAPGKRYPPGKKGLLNIGPMGFDAQRFDRMAGQAAFAIGGGPADEDAFVRRVVEPFEAKYKTKRPKEITELFYGSKNMWYLEVKC